MKGIKIKFNCKAIDVVVLCGGLGTRLQSVMKDCPKSMATINGRPFLDILIENVASYGFCHFVLCTGHKKDYIKQYYSSKKCSLDITFSEEKKLLGTGGAIKNAKLFVESNPFLVMNGDSVCPLDLSDFLRFHTSTKADISMVLIKSENAGDYGSVVLDDKQRIISFNEKTQKKNGFISGGVYLFNQSILSLIPPDSVYSLEYDLFPKLTNNKFYGYVFNGDFVDIGTPERYKKAELCIPNTVKNARQG